MKFPSFPRARGPAERGLTGVFGGWQTGIAATATGFLVGLLLLYWAGATALTGQWNEGAGSGLTVLVPRATETVPNGPETRLNAVWARLVVTPGVKGIEVLTADQDASLLRPWLGAGAKDIGMALPAVIAVRLDGGPFDAQGMAARLVEAAPGTIVEEHGAWSGQPGRLARDLRVYLNLLLAMLAVAAMVPVGAAAWRETMSAWPRVLLVSQLGATDGYAARSLAARIALFAGIGGLGGTICAIPVALGLAGLGTVLTARPLSIAPLALPPASWALLLLLPAALAAIGAGVAYVSVRWRLGRIA